MSSCWILGLPGRDGFAVIQDIRKRALTPIVVLSAARGCRRQGQGAGAGRRRLCDKTVRYDRTPGPAARRIASRASVGG